MSKKPIQTQQFQAAKITQILDIDQVKIKTVWFVNPTEVNFILHDSINSAKVGQIVMESNHIKFGSYLVPLTNVKIMELGE